MTTSVLIVAVLVLLVLLIVAAVIRLREIGACLVLIDARVDSANRRLHRIAENQVGVLADIQRRAKRRAREAAATEAQP